MCACASPCNSACMEACVLACTSTVACISSYVEERIYPSGIHSLHLLYVDWGINLACLYIWTMNNLTGPPQFGICLKSHPVMIGDIRLQKMTANMPDFEYWVSGAFYFSSSQKWWGFLAAEPLYLMVPSDLWLQAETLSLYWGSCPILETLSCLWVPLPSHIESRYAYLWIGTCARGCTPCRKAQRTSSSIFSLCCPPSEKKSFNSNTATKFSCPSSL